MIRIRPFRSAVVRFALRSAAVASAVVLTMALAQQPSRSAFVAATGTNGSSATAAGDFCGSPPPSVVTASADSTAYQSSPTVTSGSNANLVVISTTNANARTVLRFSPLPTRPPGCVLSGATLRLYASSAQSGRTMDVYLVDPSATWTEANISWNTLPATTGTAISAASLSAGWQAWTVTPLMASLFASNNGLVLRDRNESSTPTATQVYESRESATAANRPQLVLTWS